MAKTDSDLLSQAICDVTQASAAPSRDVTRLSPRVDTFLADLAARRVTGTIDKAAISDALFPELVRLFGEIIAPSLGRASDGETITQCEARLRELSRLDRTVTSKIVKRILSQLEILGQGKNALDATEVADRLPEILGDLALRQVIYSASPDDVPDEAIPSLTRYCVIFLTTPDAEAALWQAERRLRALTPPPENFDVMCVPYY